MKRFSWVIFFTFLMIFIQHIDSQAQNIQKNINIHWLPNLIYEESEDEKIEYLFFEGAVGDEQFPGLPSFYTHFPVNSDFLAYNVKITHTVFEPMTEQEVALIPQNFSPNELEITTQTVYEKKKPYLAISFIPIKKNGVKFEKLTSVTLEITGKDARKSPAAPKSYTTHSVLQNGSWYRITVSQTGVYKVTYDDLSRLGMPVSGLSSDNLSIFGNGGGMLPEANAEFRYDDIQELPIEMHDGGDHSFDAGDYFLFYAEGPHSWTYNPFDQNFTHNFNLYATTASYFITATPNVGSKLRITTEDNSALTATSVATTYTDYGFFEEDKFNLGEGGRAWFGDKFDATTAKNYTLSIPASPVSPLRLTANVGATSARYSSFSISINGQNVGSISVDASGDYLAKTNSREFSFNTTGGNVAISLSYSKPLSSSVGYLNFLEWQVDAQLRAGGGQTPFCNTQTVGNNRVTQFDIANFSNGMKVWDVTSIPNVKQMDGTLSGGTFSFKAATDSLRKFLIFKDNNAMSVTPVGKINNQDLHGSSLADMIIISHPDFLTQAERLADFRRNHDGLSVKIVTPQQVYNEFSSGEQDVCAIRDYIRMIYDKTNGQQPKYLLLFGRPSYDYRQIEGKCKLYVPNYQCYTTIKTENFKANDDFFGLLDEDEGNSCSGRTVDIAIGRFPVSNSNQAQIAVDKTINYASTAILGANTQTCNYGDWKNTAAFVADDENWNCHINTAEATTHIAQNENTNLNIEKIYLDAYQQITYSSSARYPEVTTAINNRMNKGCLLFTYIGHGGKYGWAHERIIELTDINRWSNKYNQPWMFTMTCEFGWCDRSFDSPAELVFLNANGGAAGMVSTMRTAFTVGNHNYITGLYNNIFRSDNGNVKRLGETHRLAKNAGGGNCGDYNMIYVIGDPAMSLALPRFVVVTDSINGIAADEFSDTLKALSRVYVCGHIEDGNGTTLDDFSGGIYPSIYDKKVINNTLQNDEESLYLEFDVQKNILFKGNVTVNNGRFSYSFILPKDINYAYGLGKMSYYANSDNADAAGTYNRAIIGGMSDDSITDTHGPDIELFMNDEKFVNGGTVNPFPTLLVKLKDEYGINTTGNGIGHDLVAILDDGNQIILNNYYEAERDSFNCGTVRYPFENLSLGQHKLKVRGWDILNNVSESELEFVVASDEGLTLDHVLNYPNPFTTRTSFYFEHNRPGEALDILVTVYTISGKVVRTLESHQCNQGFRSDPIEWDGLDDFGDKIGKGTYLYRLRVRTANGEQSEKIEKIVIL